MPFGTWGWAAGSFLSARVVWATTVELNCSENSRRRVAMRRSESRAIFCATALSSMGFTLDAGGGELVVELVEEGSDVRGLRGHLGAGRRDDFRLKAETGCDIEAG